MADILHVEVKGVTYDIASSGGGAVSSVNGQTGAVVLDAEDVGALPDDTVIPSKTSDLTNDSNFITAAQAPVQSVNGQTGAVSLPIPTVPTDVSDFNNDAGYITSADIPVTSVNTKTGAVVLGASDVGALPDTTAIPSKTSDLTNDSGFITSAQAPVQSVNGNTGAVNISVPTKTSDLANDSGFITSAPVSSVNGQTGAVVLDAEDVGALPDDTAIPSKTSDLTNDANFITAAQAPVQSVNGKTGAVALSASDVNALPDNTAIPSKTSDLTNDSGFITGMEILSYGSSTWADFIAAYRAKKVVYARASSNANPASGTQTRLAFMAYVNNAESPTSVEFQYYRSVSSHSASQQGDQVFIYTLTSSGWTVTTREAATKIAAGTNMSQSYSNGTLTLNATQPTVPSPSSAAPSMDGTAAAGSSTDYARADHVHPTDTSRQAALVSGQNIKTINNESLLGSGNITIQGGGGGSSSDAYDLIIKCNGAGFTNVASDYQIVKGSLANILAAKEQNTLITGVCHSLVKYYDDDEDVTNDIYSIARLCAINDSYSGQTYPGWSANAQLTFIDFSNKKRVTLVVNDEETILTVRISSY